VFSHGLSREKNAITTNKRAAEFSRVQTRDFFSRALFWPRLHKEVAAAISAASKCGCLQPHQPHCSRAQKCLTSINCNDKGSFSFNTVTKRHTHIHAHARTHAHTRGGGGGGPAPAPAAPPTHTPTPPPLPTCSKLSVVSTPNTTGTPAKSQKSTGIGHVMIKYAQTKLFNTFQPRKFGTEYRKTALLLPSS